MSSSTGLDERRVAILHAVWQVIAERGVSAVSMRNVAAAAGVSVGQIQYWFRTKDELLRASLDEMLSAAERVYADSEDTDSGDTDSGDTQDADDRETLWRLLWLPIPRAETTPVGVSVFYGYVTAAINHPVLARMLTEAQDGQEREAARLLARINPELEDPRGTARSLVATADGLAMRVLIGGLSGASAERTLRADVDRATTYAESSAT